MIITCPACETRYTVKAEAFPPEGRSVKCARCGHQWRQMPMADGAMDDATGDAAGDVMDRAGEAAGGARGAPAHGGTDTGEVHTEPAPDGTPEPEPVAEPATLTARAATPADALRARARPRETEAPAPRGGILGRIIGWGGLAVAIGAIATAAFVFRGEIVALWPQTAGAYAALGADVNRFGLEFQNVVSAYETDEGAQVLAISGDVVNVGDGPRTLPRVRVSFRNAEAEEIYNWSFAIEPGELGAGERRSFITRVTDIPPGAADVEVRFADAAD